MILIERTERVPAPVAAVWDVVRRVEQLAEWLAGVDAAEALSGEGFGRRQRLRTADGSTLEAEVFAYREPTLIAWRERTDGAGGRADARTETRVELAPDGAGTAVRLIVVRCPAGPLTGALLRLGVHRIGAGLEASIARLAEITGAPTAATDAREQRGSGASAS
jgi:uncharacterized protein YndB with AHSA1/START domain